MLYNTFDTSQDYLCSACDWPLIIYTICFPAAPIVGEREGVQEGLGFMWSETEAGQMRARGTPLYFNLENQTGAP